MTKTRRSLFTLASSSVLALAFGAAPVFADSWGSSGGGSSGGGSSGGGSHFKLHGGGGSSGGGLFKHHGIGGGSSGGGSVGGFLHHGSGGGSRAAGPAAADRWAAFCTTAAAAGPVAAGPAAAGRWAAFCTTAVAAGPAAAGRWAAFCTTAAVAGPAADPSDDIPRVASLPRRNGWNLTANVRRPTHPGKGRMRPSRQSLAFSVLADEEILS